LYLAEIQQLDCELIRMFWTRCTQGGHRNIARSPNKRIPVVRRVLRALNFLL
jgi:hypothetical protein